MLKPKPPKEPKPSPIANHEASYLDKRSRACHKIVHGVLAVFILAGMATANSVPFSNPTSNIGSSGASDQEPADIHSDNKVRSDLNQDNTVDSIGLSMLLSKWGEVVAGSGVDPGDKPTVKLSFKKGFPDLWGEGADHIDGGRGGMKFFITSLADTSEATLIAGSATTHEHYEGTFRGAMALSGRRHIIPRISGQVKLGSTVLVSRDGDFSYHGHLAPKGGLYINSDRLIIRESDNAVVRFMRLRFGNESELSIDDAFSVTRSNQVAIDHCSFGWAGDETFSINHAPNSSYVDIIAQNNIIGQSRFSHNTGSLIGYGGSGGEKAHGVVSWHNNVYVGVTHRTPNFMGDSGMYGRIYNNIAYDWQYRLTNVVGAPTVDVGYNYYKKGPMGENIPLFNYNKYQDLRDTRPYPPSIYAAGNIAPGVLEDPDADNSVLWTYFGSANPLLDSLFRSAPLAIDAEVGFQPSSAQQAYDRIVVNREVGANRSTDEQGNPIVGHDSVDDEYLAAIESGTDARTPEAEWVHPAVSQGSAYTDSNWNGIADSFEDEYGIDSADQVIPLWDFGAYRVENYAAYDAFEIYSAWVAGDFERLLQ